MMTIFVLIFCFLGSLYSLPFSCFRGVVFAPLLPFFVLEKTNRLHNVSFVRKDILQRCIIIHIIIDIITKTDSYRHLKNVLLSIGTFRTYWTRNSYVRYL